MDEDGSCLLEKTGFYFYRVNTIQGFIIATQKDGVDLTYEYAHYQNVVSADWSLKKGGKKQLTEDQEQRIAGCLTRRLVGQIML